MKTVPELAKQLMEKMYPNIDESCRYSTMHECERRVLSTWPIVSIISTGIQVRTPDRQYAGTLKGAGYRWTGSTWEKKCRDANTAITELRTLDRILPDAVIAPGQESVLAKL